MSSDVYIKNMQAIASAGGDESSWVHFLRLGKHGLTKTENGDYAGLMQKAWRDDIDSYVKSVQLSKMDPTVHFAAWCADKLSKEMDHSGDCGLSIASSRGATTLWEKMYADYSKEGKALSPLTSPLTTLGNLSSNVAKVIHQNVSFGLSHSMTCSSSLHALINGMSWLKSEMVDQCIVGGTEAPVTTFTIDQFKALRIYSKYEDYPCSPFSGKNAMVLGEGAALFGLDLSPEKALARIVGVGYAMEQIQHPVEISENGEALKQSMQSALGSNRDVDVIFAHAPGTKKGDQSELRAIQSVFGEDHPPLYSHKWITGHTLGASGGIALYIAMLSMMHDDLLHMPSGAEFPKRTKRVLINATGFGGNACSILIEKC